METGDFFRVVVKRNKSTDPTYKEWKHISLMLLIFSPPLHGSYLQGMETCNPAKEPYLDPKHGSYLQGMETMGAWFWGYLGDNARILPTRNGNHSPNCKTIFEFRRTDPTYKEWKQFSPSEAKPYCLMHGSYLQGMETIIAVIGRDSYNAARILPTRNGN